jgi:GTP-binding protein EngB required for normal cell division
MNTLLKVRRELAENFPSVTIQIFSATKGTGVDEAREVIMGWLESVETEEAI